MNPLFTKFSPATYKYKQKAIKFNVELHQVVPFSSTSTTYKYVTGMFLPMYGKLKKYAIQHINPKKSENRFL